MGLFDVGALRSKMHGAARHSQRDDGHGSAFLRRQNEERLAGNPGLSYSPNHSTSAVSLSAGQPAHLFNNGDRSLQSQRSTSGLSSRNSTRQTKLERMMGAGVPEVHVVSSQERQRPMPSGAVASPPSSDKHLSRSNTFNRYHSTTDLRDTSMSSSYARSLASDHPTAIGASTTFTEMAEVDCPVCLEPLSHRLAGEKPHVVPSCGHALHNACFTAIYGPPEAILAAQNPGSRLNGVGSASRPTAAGPPGMCGVCRKPIALGIDDHHSKSHKLTGIAVTSTPADVVTINSSTLSDRSIQEAHEDDPLELSIGKSRVASSAASLLSSSSNSHIIPILKAKPEFSTIYGKPDGKNHAKINVVSVLTVEVPTRRSPVELRDHTLGTISDEYAEEEYEQDRRDDDDSYSDDLKRSGSGWDAAASAAVSDRSRSPMPDARVGFTEQGDKLNIMARTGSGSPEEPAFSFGATPAPPPPVDPMTSVLQDLQTRVSDWKGHSIEHFGPLVLHDLLNIRQDSVVREFHVYLFQEALLCVTEEKKKGLGRFMPNASVAGTSHAETASSVKPALKLKGRIYLRHIRRVLDSSVSGEHSISITMDDEDLDQFVLCFRDTQTMSIWRMRLRALIESPKVSPTLPQTESRDVKADAEVASAAHSSLGHVRPTQTETPHMVHGAGLGVEHAPMSRIHSGTASVLSGKSGSQQGILSPQQHRSTRRLSNVSSQPSHHSGVSRGSVVGDTVPFYQQWSSSGGLDPRLAPPSLLPHTPIDLVLMISVPTVLPDHVSGSISSSAALKLRLIRSTLDFIVHNLGPKDRISLIAFTVGVEGEVKRTGLLNPGRESSRRLLEDFIANLGRPWDGNELDSFRVDLSKLGGSSDRIDSVTAVNVGLDVVLGRKAKNSVTGMMLINDMPDGPKRNQMDLVMARAEAANVPIHCFGYGKTHDPSSLWLISNHTRGSYTFVREWYQLRECLAGCIGSMMSVALTDVKIHIGVPQDNHFRIRKIAGLPGAIVSASGKDVDIDVGEIKFGEAKDMLVELELDLEALLPKLTESRSESKSMGLGPIEQGSATDDFMQRMGIQGLSLADSDGTDGYLEQLVEEVGVFEADVSFKDPATGTTTSRLANPGVLTLEVDTHSTDPLSNGPPGLAAVVADPTVTRRRLEVLVSEMMTRSLLLISRKNHEQAHKVITETRRIIDTVVQALNGPGQSKRRSLITHRSNQRKQREAANRRTICSLMAMMSDLDVLSDGLEHQHRSTFERDGRNFGAQQAMILRDQKAWTTRSDTEYLNFKDDNAAAFTAWSASYAASR